MTVRLVIIAKTLGYGLLSILLAFVAFLATSFIVAVVSTQNTVDEWYAWQNAHIAELTAAYENGTAPKINEADFCGFDLDAALSGGSKINDLRYLATHNSYKMGVSKETDFFYNRAFPLVLGKYYDYVFDPITAQLNNGIRSFEIDVNKVKDGDGFSLRCVHSTMLEQQSSMIDLVKGFKEMKMWSDYNPNHMPIIVLIEPKGGIAGSKYQSMDDAGYTALENALTNTFGEKLITPGDVLGSYENMKTMRAANAYPTLAESKGKFIFLLHDKKGLAEKYIARDVSMHSQKMFMAVAEDSSFKNPNIMDRVAFSILNNTSHHDKIVDAVTNGNFIVRTRLDEYAKIDDARYLSGMTSGAHILSTDYPNMPSNKSGYICQITADNKTMLLKKHG